MSWWNKNESDSESIETTESAPKASGQKTEAAPRTSAQGPQPQYGEVRSALGEGTVIQGKLSFDTPVRIDGNLSGEVFSSSILIVGEKGRISADVNVETLVILGTVSGEVKARKRLELHKSGELIGDIDTPSLYIEEGAYFEGGCVMHTEKEKEATKSKETKTSVPIVKRADDKQDKAAEKGSGSKNPSPDVKDSTVKETIVQSSKSPMH